jgi:hypothetical protein
VATNKRIYRLPKFLCKDVLQVGHLLKGIFSP